MLASGNPVRILTYLVRRAIDTVTIFIVTYKPDKVLMTLLTKFHDPTSKP